MNSPSFPAGSLAATWTCKYNPFKAAYQTQTTFTNPRTKETVWETKPIEALESDINNPDAAVFGADNKTILEHDWNHFWGSLGEQASEWAEASNAGFQVRTQKVLEQDRYPLPDASTILTNNGNYSQQYRLGVVAWNLMEKTDAFVKHLTGLNLPKRRETILKAIESGTKTVKKEKPQFDQFFTVARDQMTPEQFTSQAKVLDEQLKEGQKSWEGTERDPNKPANESIWAVRSYRDLFSTETYHPDTDNRYLNVSA
jgi:hypothetical protein